MSLNTKQQYEDNIRWIKEANQNKLVSFCIETLSVADLVSEKYFSENIWLLFYDYFENSSLILRCQSCRQRITQIVIIFWANASILSAVLLARGREMTLARCHFAHRANLIANRWFGVGPTSVAQQALHMPT